MAGLLRPAALRCCLISFVKKWILENKKKGEAMLHCTMLTNKPQVGMCPAGQVPAAAGSCRSGAGLAAASICLHCSGTCTLCSTAASQTGAIWAPVPAGAAPLSSSRVDPSSPLAHLLPLPPNRPLLCASVAQASKQLAPWL